jgi:hypothetical protein
MPLVRPTATVAVIAAHAANELNIISCLSQRDLSELTRVLRRLHLALNPHHRSMPGMGLDPTSP